MTSMLTDLGITTPVLAAPMAGGPTTVELVTAAAQVGSLGFLAAGYRDAGQLAEQIEQVRMVSDVFGVNLFAPNRIDIDVADYRAYARQIQPVADKYGVELPTVPRSDEDLFDDKLAVLRDDPVPVVSFTFGIPSQAVIAGLQRLGMVTVQSVTNVDEARAAADAGVDMLAVQGCFAGGHSATLTAGAWPVAIPTATLVSSIRAATSLPIVAGGGLNSPGAVREVISSGAAAAMVGTALLLSPEAGTSATHRAALTDPSRRETVLTRAFTGRPARGIRNSFIDRFDALAPIGYPAIHHLTSALRKAAAAAGDPEAVHLWAGTGFRSTEQRPVGELLTYLAGDL